MVTERSFEYDNLISGDHTLVTEGVTVAEGENLEHGAVVALVDGKVVKSDPAGDDGSEEPYGILAEDVDATGGDKKSVAYLSGQFNERRIKHGDWAMSELRPKLRTLSIYLEPSVPA